MKGREGVGWPREQQGAICAKGVATSGLGMGEAQSISKELCVLESIGGCPMCTAMMMMSIV